MIRTLKSIASILALPFLILSPSLAQLAFDSAGVTTYQEQGLSVNYDRGSVTLPNGELVMVWSALDVGGYNRIQAQIATPEGQLRFPEAGLDLSPPDLNAWQPASALLSSGRALIAWIESAGAERWVVKLQILAADGRIVLREGGVETASINTAGFPGIGIVGDYDGGLIIQFYNNPRRVTSIWRYDAEGLPLEAWPEEGVELNGALTVQADEEGGCWVTQGSQFNRLDSSGRLVWEEFRAITPPGDGYLQTPFWSTINGNLLWACFAHVSQRQLGVSLYNRDGERVAGANIPLSNEWIMEWDHNPPLVDERRLYFCHGVIDSGGDVIVPHDPVAYCYAPFEENSLPWGEEGIAFAEEGEVFVPPVNVVRLDEFIYFISDEMIFGLTLDGEYAWETPSRQLNTDIDIFTGNRHHLWGINRYYSDLQAWKFNADGRSIFGANPVHLMPNPRGEFESLGLADFDGVLQMAGYDMERGLIGQGVTTEGEVLSSLEGEVLDEEFPYTSKWCYGRLTNRLWCWGRWQARWGRLALVNAQGGVVGARTIDLGGQGVFSDEEPEVVSNHTDRLLFNVQRNQRSRMLMEFDQDGDWTGSIDLATPGTRSVSNISYWDGQGWVILLRDGQNSRLQVLQPDFSYRWEEPLILPGGLINMVEVEGNLVLAGRVSRAERQGYDIIRVSLTPDGEMFDVMQTPLFAPGVSNSYPTNITLSPVDGSAWLICEAIGGYQVQLFTRRWNRALGDSGLFLEGRRSNFYDGCHAIPDEDGGAWLVWSASGSIRATHLGRWGRPARAGYPLHGFPVFGEGRYSLIGVTADESAEQVWVVALRSQVEYGRLVGRQHRVQLLGDWWLGVEKEQEYQPLEQELTAYPNPFNSSTTISYTLPKAGWTVVDVMDIQGRLVERLSGGWKAAGSYREVWRGEGVTSGEYLIKLQSDKTPLTKPVTVIR
jgi:hypothetical protein